MASGLSSQDLYRQQLTDAKMRSLDSEGYCVIDGFFGLERATKFREEIQWLEREKLMKPNQTQFGLGNGETLVVRKPHIFEVDLHDDEVRAKVPSLDQLFQEEALVEVLNEKDPALCLVKGKSGKTIKLQYNCGNGGCFPLHYDNPGKPNKRKLTCLLYLNPGWVEGHGGELQLVPFLQPPVTIAPLMDRLVIFHSERVLHRVLQSHTERLCFTVWLDGHPHTVNKQEHNVIKIKKKSPPPPQQQQQEEEEQQQQEEEEEEETQVEGKDPTIDKKPWNDQMVIAELAAYLRSCPSQRIVSRAVYQEEYEASLREGHKGTQGLNQMLLLHRAHLQAVQKNPPLRELVLQLRQLKNEKGK